MSVAVAPHGLPAVVVADAATGSVAVPVVGVARGFYEHLRGLLGTRELPPGTGLWLTNCSSIHTCFMAYAIDAVFLDAQGTAVRIFAAVRPWRFTPFVAGARDCLELPAGGAAAAGIRVGTRLVRVGGETTSP